MSKITLSTFDHEMKDANFHKKFDKENNQFLKNERAILEAQHIVKKYNKSQRALSEELIKVRRREADAG